MCSNLDLHYIPYVCTSDYVGRFPQSRSQTFPSGGPVDFPGDYHIDDVEEFVSVASEEINRSQPVNFVLVFWKMKTLLVFAIIHFLLDEASGILVGAGPNDMRSNNDTRDPVARR
jgi:hypothetical protein